MGESVQTGQSLRKLIGVSICVAAGLVLAPLLVINLGFAKAFPVQHMLNVFLAVLFGTSYSTGGAFALSSLRNLMGTGTILAYPGSLFGALFAGILYRRTGSILAACLGEVIGTGLVGGYVAYLIAVNVLGSNIAATAMLIPFLTSSAAGAILAGVVLIGMPASLRRAIQGK